MEIQPTKKPMVEAAFSLSNVEIIMDSLSRHWLGLEEWLTDAAIEINVHNKTLRDYYLRVDKNTLSQTDHYIRLALHYYTVASCFNNLYQKYQFDIKSVIFWLEKSLGFLNEIPGHSLPEKHRNLLSDVKYVLSKMSQIRDGLMTERANLSDLKSPKGAQLRLALGDLSGRSLVEFFDPRELKYHSLDRIRQLQNLSLLTLIAYLEDSLHPNSPHGITPITWKMTLWLSNAYFLAEIDSLVTGFKNTYEKNIKTWLSGSKSNNRTEGNIINIIRDGVQTGSSLQDVKSTLLGIHQSLSATDEAYVERKYIDVCLKKLIQESLNFLTERSENGDRQLIVGLIFGLEGFDSFLKIPHPLNHMPSYQLLLPHYSLLNKEDERQLVQDMKKKIQEVLADYVILGRRELAFLEALINFLGFSKQSHQLEAVLNLHLYCTTDIPFGGLIQRVLCLETEEFGDDVVEIQYAAEPLRKQKDLLYADKFRELLLDYLKPPVIRSVQLDGRNVLEVRGKKVVLSDVARREPFEQFRSCDELRIIASCILHVDKNLEMKEWTGKNIVVLSKVIRVHDAVIWDVSGMDSTHEFLSGAGTHSNGDGENGEDGRPGESGGNVLILVEKVVDGGNWTIVSQGGQGSGGQNGGNGRNGTDGAAITEEDFKSCFPAAAKMSQIDRLSNINKTLNSMKDCYLAQVTSSWFMRSFSSSAEANIGLQDFIDKANSKMYSRASFFAKIHIKADTPSGIKFEFSVDCGDGFSYFCQAYLLCKGAEGKAGGKGGAYGLGGEGGHGGEVLVKNPNDYRSVFNVVIRNANGRPGPNGQPGQYGTHGANGWDIGYLDYEISGFFSSNWPKYYGLDQNSKIKLTYHDSGSSDRVWSPDSSKYVGMSSQDLEDPKQCHYEQSNTAEVNRDRRSYAKAKQRKTISQASITSEYQHLFDTTERDSLNQLYAELDSASDIRLQQMTETENVQVKIDVSTHISRVSPYDGVKQPATVPVEPFQMACQTKNEDAIVRKIIHDLSTNAMPIHAWLASRKEHISKKDFDELWKSLEIFKMNGGNVTPEVNHYLLDKRRFAVLEKISQKLLEIEEPPVEICSVDSVSVTECLKINLKFETGASHYILGTLDQYLFQDSVVERAKVARYCTEELQLEGDFLKAFRSFILEIGPVTPNIQLKACYDHYKLYLDKQEKGLIVFQESFDLLDHIYSRKDSTDYKTIIDQLDFYCHQRGVGAEFYIELLALVFDVNIRVYVETGRSAMSFFLKGNFNHQPRHGIVARHHFIHILSRSEKFVPLEVDWSYVELAEHRALESDRYSKILADVESLLEKVDFDNYVIEEKYLEKGIYEELPLQKSLPDEKSIVSKIMAFYPSINEDLGMRLGKISSIYVGKTDILQIILKRFSCESSLVSSGELCCLVNSVLHSAGGKKCDDVYRWIVAAYPQEQWIDQLLIADCELLLGKVLSKTIKSKWATYLKNIADKRILLVLKDKLERSKNEPEPGASLVDCVDSILAYLSEITCEYLQFDQLGLQEWPFALKEKYWTSKLMQLLESASMTEVATLVYYTMTIENLYGPSLTQKLVSTLVRRKAEITQEMMFTILHSLFNEAWGFTMVKMEMLTSCKHVGDWVTIMKQGMQGEDDGNDRSIDSLVSMVSSGEEPSESIRGMLPIIQENLYNLLRGGSPSSLLHNTKDINKFTKYDVENWVKAFQKKTKGLEDEAKKAFIDGIREEMLSVVDRAVHLLRSFRLRNTQWLTVLVLLRNPKSTLAQVSTGEGKSLIVVALSILRALAGEKVDIVTSSSVLAKRDAFINKDIYGLFGINVSHNCSEDVDIRKTAYSNNEVVYGDLSDFQRDHLLQMFYNKNVLGDRRFEAVIVDEVDSMLLDKGKNMLYLSRDIPLLDKLESVYVFIWQWISRPCMSRAQVLDTMSVVEIREAVMDDIYGLIRLKHLKTLDHGLSDVQLSELWERLERSTIIDEESHLLIKALNRKQVEDLLFPNFTQLTDPLCFLINDCLNRERHIDVPHNLKLFIKMHLDGWIRNAFAAYFMEAGEDYVVDVDRTGTSSDRNPRITIIDKDTGADQANSQWDEALHQFLQLKHGCKLSVQSLKAVFVSNVSYFKLYNHLYGLTGTLGSDCERKLLKKFHDVDFVTIPTAKAKRFSEHTPTMCPSEDAWFNAIQDATKTCIAQDGRSVLIICETVNVVHSLHHFLGEKGAKHLHTYTREFEEFDITQSGKTLGPGHVIVATNLAGRGTDIKINEPLRLAGGLHVILTYLPRNTRIEQQAFGRAARCGDKGSGQLVILSPSTNTILHLKTLRDNEELKRITDIKDYYNNHISVEEMCFGRFGKQFRKLKDSFLKEEGLKEVFEKATRGDFIGIVNKFSEQLGENKSNLFQPTSAGFLILENKKAPPIVEKILLQSCIDQWALWLDANKEFVNAWPDPDAQRSLSTSLENFLSTLTGLSCENEKDWMKWVHGQPVAMVSLAKYFMQTKQYHNAIFLLDQAIDLEPNFSECARYYKAGALGMKTDFESHLSQEQHDTVNLKRELRQVTILLEKLRTRAMNNATIMNQLKARDKRSIIQVKAYEEQQTSIDHLYNMFSLSVDDILGHSVSPESFITWNIKYHLSCNVFDTLLKNGILKYSEVTLQNTSGKELEKLCCGYNILPSDLKTCLESHSGVVKDLNSFKAEMKKQMHLPSRGGFWKELIRGGLLFKEISFVVIDNNKLEEVDPSLLDTLLKCDISEKILKEETNTLFMNRQQITNCPEKRTIVLKKGLMELIGDERFSLLKRYGVFSFNKKGDYDLALLKAAATPLTPGGDQGVLHDGNDVVMDSLRGPHSQRFRFSCYDSVSPGDLIKNEVSPLYAGKILNELVGQGLIKRIANSDSYQLERHYSEITSIVLSSSVYSNVTKAVLNVCFSYRIALQKLAEDATADFQLTTKPHSGLLWDLHSLNIVTSVSVCHRDDRKETLKKAFGSKFHRDTFKELLTPLVCESNEVFSRLIDHLIAQGWLNGSPSELNVERDKKKRRPLGGDFGRYQKTIARILDDVLVLSEEATIATLEHLLDQKSSRLSALGVPCFGFKLLVEACGERDFSRVQEIQQFLLSGFDSLIVLEEKRYTLKFWLSVTALVVIGICQIVVGVLIDIYAVGMLTHAGNAFMGEGVGDLVYALGAMRTGYFSWKDYATYKITSVCFTIISGGVAMWWARGVRFSRVGQKLCGTGLQIGGKTGSQTTGAAALNQIGKSVFKETVKEVAVKTAEGVAYGAINMAVDAAVENHLRSLCEGISSEISAEIESAVEKHRIGSLLERVYIEKGAQAQAMVMDLTRKFLTEPPVWDELFSSLAFKIFSSVSNGIAQAAEKEFSAGQSSARFVRILHFINTGVVWSERVHQLSMVVSLTDEMMEGMTRKLEKELGKRPQALQEKFDQVKYKAFKRDIVEHWKKSLREKSGNIIAQQLVRPLTSFGIRKLCHYVKQGVKSFYQSRRDNYDRRRLEDCKRQYRDDIERAVDEDTRDLITRKYHGSLIILYRRTRDPKVAAAIIRENVQLDMTCLEAYTIAYSSLLKSQGVQEKLKIVVEKDGEGVKQEFLCDGGGNGPTTTIRLRLKDGHYEAIGIDGRNLDQEVTHDGALNSCLYQGISRFRDLGMSAREFRETIAKTIENDASVQNIILQGWHKYGMHLSMYGGNGPHPFEKIGCWNRDPHTDIDNLEYEKGPNGEKIWKKVVDDDVTNRVLKKSFNDVLRKINLTIQGKCDQCCSGAKGYSKSKCKHATTISEKGWKEGEVKLMDRRELKPEDFQVTMYDTIKDANGELALFPVEMVVKVEIKAKGVENPVTYDVNINLDKVYRDGQAGPQGPHVGYYITRRGKKGPQKVVGHCTFSDGGNKNLPHRACPQENVPGIVFVDSEDGQRFLKEHDYRKIDHTRLFTDKTLFQGFRLERAHPYFEGKFV